MVGRVIGKGLTGDEMGKRVYLVTDGVDHWGHHMEFADPARINMVCRDMIVAAVPTVFDPMGSDRNIAISYQGGGRSRALPTSRAGISTASATAWSGRARTRRRSAVPISTSPGGTALGRPGGAHRRQALKHHEGHYRAGHGL